MFFIAVANRKSCFGWMVSILAQLVKAMSVIKNMIVELQLGSS